MIEKLFWFTAAGLLIGFVTFILAGRACKRSYDQHLREEGERANEEE